MHRHVVAQAGSVAEFLGDGLPHDVLLAMAVVLLGLFVSRYVTRIIRAALGDSMAGEVSIVVNIGRAVVAFLVASFVGENLFDIELSGLAQALGVTTLVVSLGLQDFIKNVVAGIQIVMTKLFSAGDQLEVGGKRGEVLDVNWRQTTLRDKDGNSYVVPNAELMAGTFMRREGKMRYRYMVECDIKPGLDLERVAADIQELADGVLDERGWRAGENTEVRFVGATANGVRASIRFFLSDIEYTTRATDAVMRAIGQRGYLADWTNDAPAQQRWY